MTLKDKHSQYLTTDGDAGASLLEYALLIAFIAVIAVTSMTSYQESRDKTWNDVNSAFGTALGS